MNFRNKLGLVLFLISANCTANEAIKFKNNLTLKNLYSERDYTSNTKNIGSWSQGFIYQGNFEYQYNNELKFSINPSFQYAYRLSDDKGISDTILPFDDFEKKQYRDYNKKGINFKLNYEQHSIGFGEFFLNTPLLTSDPSRQLVSSFNGIVYIFDSKDQKIALGYIDEYSRRNSEEFEKISVNSIESDGVIYFNYKKNFNNNDFLLYNGYLEDLYNQTMLGLNVNYQLAGFGVNSKLRFFNNSDVGESKLGSVENQYYGFMNYIQIDNNLKLGFGYHEINGNRAYPLIDGIIPVLEFVDWSQGTFTKKDESAYHLLFGYNFNDYIKGLNFESRYIYGNGFKTLEKNDYESEFHNKISYVKPDGYLKGLSLLWLNIDYNTKYGKGYNENRIMTSYNIKF